MLNQGKPLGTATVSGMTSGCELHVSTQPLEKSDEQVGVCRKYAKESESAEEFKPSDGSIRFVRAILWNFRKT
jgi:hypothetical protein